ncbi:MAG TPA: 2'-5' RNA ligase family protein [Gaiellaceae bacterium]|nr:2'-5' RNA ligase family protein [Gaiellaceae bacterium]
MPRSALIVAVPEAEPVVGEWREHYDSARLGIPAHITLLVPFVPTEELDEGLFAELRELFAAEPPIMFTLARLVTFPDETIWLAPEPSEPFRRLTELIVERFPDYPPYEGIHDDVIPHLTVTSGETSLLAELEAAVSPHLPIAAEAHDVVLLEEDHSELWRVRERFPLRAS